MLVRIFLRLYNSLGYLKNLTLTILRDKSASAKIPNRTLEEMARCFLPDILAIYATPAGCGKSTLLRHLKSCLTPHGLFSGEIRYQGTLLSELSQRE